MTTDWKNLPFSIIFSSETIGSKLFPLGTLAGIPFDAIEMLNRDRNVKPTSQPSNWPSLVVIRVTAA